MKRTLLVLVVLALVAVGVGAQQGMALDGLVINLRGDLYEWDGTTLAALTNYGANEYPIQSPDGRYIAYRSMSALADGQSAAGARPMNIWLLDRQSGTFTRVADDNSGFRYRGEPAWSPDSTRLAWTEHVDGNPIDGNLDLVVYDLPSGTQTLVTDRFTHGPSDGGLYMPPVQWGVAGISQLYATVIMGPNPGQMIFELYDPNNGAMTSYTVGQTPDTYIVDYLWVTHRAEASVAFVTRDGVWWVLNPANGTREELAAAPTLQTTFGISNVAVTPRFVGGDSSFDFAWDATFLQQGMPPQTVTLSYLSPSVRAPYTPALGTGVIYNTTGTVAAQTLEGVQAIFNDPTFGPGDGAMFGGAVWYSTGWQTNIEGVRPPVVIPTPVVRAGCDNPPLFGPGNQIRITRGVPNNLRHIPSASGDVLGRLPAGTRMTVLEPAVCSEGYQWYRVQGTEWQGWTAAGPNHAWLERVPGTPIDPCPLPPRLRPGQLARVTAGVPNNLRANAGLSAPVTAQLPAGTISEIINGPACVDGLYWYEVLGTEWRGWTAEGQNGAYWLEVFTPPN